jgi:hypothetical protein
VLLHCCYVFILIKSFQKKTGKVTSFSEKNVSFRVFFSDSGIKIIAPNLPQASRHAGTGSPKEGMYPKEREFSRRE